MYIHVTTIGRPLKIDPKPFEKVFKEALETEAVKINKLFYKVTRSWRRRAKGSKYGTTKREYHKPLLKRSAIMTVGYDWEIHAGALKYSSGNGILSIINYGLGPRTIRTTPMITRTGVSGIMSPTQMGQHVPWSGEMVFPRGYASATRPGKLYSRRRKKFGKVIRTFVVRNHKIAARRFDLAIVRRRQKYFIKIVRNRVKKAAKKGFAK